MVLVLVLYNTCFSWCFLLTVDSEACFSATQSLLVRPQLLPYCLVSALNMELCRYDDLPSCRFFKKKKSNALGPQVMGYLKGTEQFNSITYISLTKF